MKIKINYKQKLLLEQNSNNTSFFLNLRNSNSFFNNDILSFIKESIKKSKCKKIDFANFKVKAYGASFYDKILLNNEVLKLKPNEILFIIFHELAHQYQFSKYGIEIFYDIYTNDENIKKNAKTIKYFENIADNFAKRKILELNKKFNLNLKVPNFGYNNYTDDMFETYLKNFINMLKTYNIKDKIDIAEILYNNVIHNIN